MKECIIPPSLTPQSRLFDLNFNQHDIEKAIDEIKTDSSGPDFCIPPIVLKKCKSSLAKPLFLMWDESFRVGVVPACYKEQLVTPIYKKGSRSIAANYRPISLTAHEVKLFERVIRDKIVDFLESNILFSLKQHGFRKGRNCLTQLLK